MSYLSASSHHYWCFLLHVRIPSFSVVLRILPTTGRIRGFHPLEMCAARHTIKKRHGIHGASSHTVAELIIRNSTFISCPEKLFGSLTWYDTCSLASKYLTASQNLGFEELPVGKHTFDLWYKCSWKWMFLWVKYRYYDMRGKSPSPNWPQTLENFI